MNSTIRFISSLLFVVLMIHVPTGIAEPEVRPMPGELEILGLYRPPMPKFHHDDFGPLAWIPQGKCLVVAAIGPTRRIARDCCPPQPDCWVYNERTTTYEITAKFTDLTDGEYRVALCLADSLAIVTEGMHGSITYLAFARSENTYVPNPTDSSMAQVFTISPALRAHRNIKVYYARLNP